MTDDRLFTRAELARLLGICSDTLTRWLREKRLPPPDIAPTRKAQQWRRSSLHRAGLPV
jgi:transcriptional regulator with XRE-family HTH domain